MTKIFESPDKGATVYSRDFGSTIKTILPNATRCNASVSTIFGIPLDEITYLALMHLEAKTNPALQNALERAKIIYHLSKENNGNSKT
jgi:hypothetical protein